MIKTSKISPFVYWAQTEDAITLRIELRNVQSPDVQLLNSSLEFNATGSGASGVNEYSFKFNFFKTVNPPESQYRVLDRQVEFYIRKVVSEQWPRLIAEQKKPAWLKIDFDKLAGDDDDEDDIMNEEAINTKNMYNDLLGDLKKKKKKREQTVENFRKMYLFLYNLFQTIGFSYIIGGMAYKYSQEGPDSMAGTYENFGKTFRFCQLLQLMEIIHPLLGYTKGGLMMPILQISGRLFMIFIMIEAEPRMQTKPAVFYCFLVYTLAEVIRYPYYMMRTYNFELSFVTWFRYTAWIILYPLGFFCEGVIILRNIPYFEETGKFSFTLPNIWNFSFYFPTLLRGYLLLAFFPSLYMMMTHMYSQRVKMLRTQEPLKIKKR